MQGRGLRQSNRRSLLPNRFKPVANQLRRVPKRLQGMPIHGREGTSNCWRRQNYRWELPIAIRLVSISEGPKARKMIAQGKRDEARAALGYVPQRIFKPC